MSNNSQVFINGVLQHPNTNYKYTGKGFTQLTGKSSMSVYNPITITSPGIQAQTIQSLNLGNLTSNSTSYGFDFGVANKTHELLRKYEVYESTEDIVALASAAHRIMRDSTIYYKITDRDLYAKVEQRDRDNATAIKDYYSKKVMMWKLKGDGKLSSFRNDMNHLIHSDGLTFKENMLGVAYWLPIFHQYDLQVDDVKMQVDTNQNFTNMVNQGTPRTLGLTSKLTPIKAIRHVTKRAKNIEYWLKDDKCNAAVVITVDEKNQLKHLWDYLFDTEKVLQIKGNYFRKHRDDFEYFGVTNWEIDRG
jgi:hypothetical protein